MNILGIFVRFGVLLVFCILFSCSKDREMNPLLLQVKSKIDDSPELAISMLDSICKDTLSEYDRHVYDFLRIKASDKAYITHTSDSLILDVISHFSKSNNLLYSESLYYGGRVYDDIGDKQLALKYYYNALNSLSDRNRDFELEGRILIQIAQTLKDLRLYNKSMKFTIRAIDNDLLRCDTLNFYNDRVTLGELYLKTGNYDKAVRIFSDNMEISKNLDLKYQKENQLLLAVAYYKIGRNDLALSLIRGLPETIMPRDRNYALANAIKIYNKAGYHDTAILYAKQLINEKMPDNKISGYRALTSKELRKYSSADSLMKYSAIYDSLVGKKLDSNGNPEALMESSMFNYNIQQNKRVIAEEKNKHLQTLFVIFLFLSSGAAIGLFYFLIAYRRKKHEIIKALDKNDCSILQLENENIDDKHKQIVIDNNDIDYSKQNIDLDQISNDIQENEIIIYLKQFLKNKLGKDIKTVTQYTYLSPEILTSPAYMEMSNFINQRKGISNQNQLWNDIEDLILSEFPQFLRNLYILSQNRLSKDEINTAVLIKLNVTPSEASRLMNKSRSTITYKRMQLVEKLFKKEVPLRLLDIAIRMI